MKEGIHPKYLRGGGALRVRRDLEDALDEAGAAPRNLQQLPSVLHGPAEAGRHGRPRGAVHEAVRRADVREPQAGGEVEEAAGRRQSLRYEKQLSTAVLAGRPGRASARAAPAGGAGRRPASRFRPIPPAQTTPAPGPSRSRSRCSWCIASASAANCTQGSSGVPRRASARGTTSSRSRQHVAASPNRPLAAEAQSQPIERLRREPRSGSNASRARSSLGASQHPARS